MSLAQQSSRRHRFLESITNAKIPLLGTVLSLSVLAGCSTYAQNPGNPSCPKRVVLTGYWPNTNEMLREWSTNPKQNLGGWVGQDWGGYGYDVYAFFPEFPPDGNPRNDAFGSEGWIGSGESDLQVDYQDTSTDFWRIMDTYQPHILITTSRGGEIGWEIEAVEGGHMGNSASPADDWATDGHGADTHPTQSTVTERSWQAISMYRDGKTLASQLPMEKILAATQGLKLESAQIDTHGTSGNYLSGFIALHGLYYNQLNPHNAAAGHIHVGISVSADNARELMRTTLDTVLSQTEAGSLGCP